MQVPLLDLKRQYAQIKPEIDKAISEVLNHTAFIGGPEVTAFETEAAAYCGSKYAVGVGSGTDALLISLRACGIKAGDEVITSTFSFFASAGVISRLGATPVFVDIDPLTYNMNPDLLEKAVTPKTKVIMPVHIFGQCADMDRILKIAEEHNLMIVEDAAQALSSSYKDRKAGTMGNFGCFSFYPTKNLGAFGDGGLITSDYSDRQTFIKSLRNHGANPKYYHSYIGYNSRLDTVQAAILSVKLKYLDRWSEGRRANARFYEEALSGLPLKLPVRSKDNYHIYNQYTIACDRRDKLIEHFKTKGIGHEVYYPLPLHAQECYRYLGYSDKDFPVASKASREVVSIPIFSDLREEEREYVAESIREFFK